MEITCILRALVMNVRHQHNQQKKTLFRAELTGAVFMITLGSSLHFVFGWSGGCTPLALVAEVNESIWEHLKLAFWPGVLWGAVMPVGSGFRRTDTFAVKGVSLLISAGLMVLIFTSFTAILGKNLLMFDIGKFVFAILVGQLLSAWLLAHGNGWRRRLSLPGLVLLMMQLAAYSLFTYFSPDHWLFIETHSGLRGIKTN